MFHVIDHADVVYTGELSQTTQYVIEHYGNELDEAIRSGIRISYADPHLRLYEVGESVLDNNIQDFWKPVEDWEID